VEAQADGGPRLTLVQWLAFAAAWAGMRPGPFARLGRGALPEANQLLRRGASRIAIGLLLVLLCRPTSALLEPVAGAAIARAAALVLALPGISLTLHFGILVILAGSWRRLGVDCRPLFREPLRARSLSEFWGRRWNLAFTEMTALAVYRPLEARFGRRIAMVAGFLVSGLLHEVAITVPVGAAYGLPTLYFAFQGALVLVETALERAGHPVQKPTWRGRLWTLLWVGLPVPVVFPPQFMAQVVLPLVGLSGP
jgi:alginate O-acetyltransferase complex protein AlgI